VPLCVSTETTGIPPLIEMGYVLLSASPPQVAIVQARMPQYLVPFHHSLRRALDQCGIRYVLIHGSAHGDATSKKDDETVDFAYIRDNHVLHIGSRQLTWQSCYDLVRSADLVIADQGSSRLTNYPLWLRHVMGRQRFALWGHGANFQKSNASQVGEAIKRFMSRHVHWWFVYNETSAAIVRGFGFPADRITNIQNSIDTRQLRQAVVGTTDEEVRQIRDRHGLRGSNVGIYVGGMYEEKRLPYLVAGCDYIRAQVDDFEMLFLGGGPQQSIIMDAAANRTWMHYVGPTFGIEKAHYLRLAKVLLMPGLVGLVILDSFASGTPLVTLADSEHSPEIEYLIDGSNGRMLPAGTGPQGYAKEVVHLLRDEDARQRLVDGGRAATGQYTIEAMVERFTDGIRRALAV
jgi:glycosyltransferase involved in cell wall biosynthesis